VGVPCAHPPEPPGHGWRPGGGGGLVCRLAESSPGKAITIPPPLPPPRPSWQGPSLAEGGRGGAVHYAEGLAAAAVQRVIRRPRLVRVEPNATPGHRRRTSPGGLPATFNAPPPEGGRGVIHTSIPSGGGRLKIRKIARIRRATVWPCCSASAPIVADRRLRSDSNNPPDCDTWARAAGIGCNGHTAQGQVGIRGHLR